MFRSIIILNTILILGLLGFFAYNNYTSQQTKPTYKTIAILGNSIVQATPSAEVGWHGNWGMAASSQDKDFTHLLTKHYTLLKFGNVSQEVEVNPGKYPPSHFKDYKADIVVLKFGENVKDVKKFAPYYQSLVDYFYPSRVMCVGSFWNTGIDEIIKKTKGCTFVDILELNEDKHLAKQFEHAGVAGHPNDRGMKAIADAILKSL